MPRPNRIPHPNGNTACCPPQQGGSPPPTSRTLPKPSGSQQPMPRSELGIEPAEDAAPLRRRAVAGDPDPWSTIRRSYVSTDLDQLRCQHPDCSRCARPCSKQMPSGGADLVRVRARPAHLALLRVRLDGRRGGDSGMRSKRVASGAAPSSRRTSVLRCARAVNEPTECAARLAFKSAARSSRSMSNRCAALIDGDRCEVCAPLEIHHIDGDRRNDAFENKVPLCRPHHREFAGMPA